MLISGKKNRRGKKRKLGAEGWQMGLKQCLEFEVELVLGTGCVLGPLTK